MTSLMVFAGLCWWHSHKLTDVSSGENLMLDTLGFPVVVYMDSLGKPTRVRWNGTAWVYDTLPMVSYTWARIDSSGHLHLAKTAIDDTFFFASETDTGWVYHTYNEECNEAYPMAFDVTGDGTLHMMWVESGLWHMWLDGDTWAFDQVPLNAFTYADMRSDKWGNLHLAGLSLYPNFLWYGFRDSSGWKGDTVDYVEDDNADFNFSLCNITVDWRGRPYIWYNPFYYGRGAI